ncbi:hypothetical protein CR513_26254, partial [Mucuna pruriens]
MGRILELLQNMEAKKGNGGSTSGVPQNSPNHPLGFTPTQHHEKLLFPPYGLPLVRRRNYPADNSPKPNVESGACQREHAHAFSNLKNAQGSDPIPIVVIHSNQKINPNSQERWKCLEERLRVIEGAKQYEFEAVDLCLVLDIVIPHKFKVLDFDKYKGNSCPKNHLVSYCRKMASHAHNDKLLIHFFQENLIGAIFGWYLNLEKGWIQTWKDLAEAFLKQYKYNKDMVPNRTQLQNMSKKEIETFKEYTQHWRELAAHIHPLLSEKRDSCNAY